MQQLPFPLGDLAPNSFDSAELQRGEKRKLSFQDIWGVSAMDSYAEKVGFQFRSWTEPTATWSY